MGRTITAGASTGVVTANTATVLTVGSWTGGTPGGTAAYTLVGWAIVTSPSTSATLNNALNAVTVVSASELWAVGYAANGSFVNQTLTEHYTTAAGTATAASSTTLTDGSAGWAVNSQAGRTITAGITTGVVTANTATVLTVASWTAGTPSSTAAYTLNGWAIVTSPNTSATLANQLNGLVLVSGTDLWAAGAGTNAAGYNQTLTEHYTTTAATHATATSSTSLTDGAATWPVNSQVGRIITSVITTGVVTSNTATVLQVASWTRGTPNGSTLYTLSGWAIVTSPNPSATQQNGLNDVDRVSATDLWAVGAANTSGIPGTTLTEHYTTAAGTATATSSTSLTQSSATWAVNSQVGRTITAGIITGVVTANTATVLTVASWTPGTPSSTAAYTLNGWAIVTSPNVGTTDGLQAVVMISSTNVWAVGFAAGGQTQTLTENYGGATTSVTGLSPSIGSTAGGTTVAVTGIGFTGAASVSFGATTGTGLVVNSDISITIVSPAEAAGTVDVVVTAPGGTSPTVTADQFTFQTAGVLSMTLALGTVSFGSVIGGTATNIPVGDITYTNSLGDGFGWSVGVVASILTSGGNTINQSSLTLHPESSTFAPGGLAPAAAASFSGSTSLPVMSGLSGQQGTFTQSGITITFVTPWGALASGTPYTGTLTYTITG